MEPTDDMLETNFAVTSHYPPVIPLMSSPVCYAEILRYYYVSTVSNEDD